MSNTQTFKKGDWVRWLHPDLNGRYVGYVVGPSEIMPFDYEICTEQQSIFHVFTHEIAPVENRDMSDNQSPWDSQVGGSHYKQLAIQPTEYIIKNNLNFAEGNVIKYVTRYKLKGGVEDLKKARHYLDMLIDIQENPNV